jgi:predicted RNA-binding protein YlqC (UPF0109 family)
MFGFLKKIFGASKVEATSSKVSGSFEPGEFVSFVVRGLVEHPEQVEISLKDEGQQQTVQIKCVKGDIGQVIGKSGRTIAALRCLVNGAAAHAGQRVRVEVLD